MEMLEQKANNDEFLIQQYKIALKTLNAGMWFWNIQTGETIFDERWAEIIGYSLNEIDLNTIETWTENAHPDDLKDSQAFLDLHFAGLTEYYEFESRMKHKDGHWVWVLDRGQVIERDALGKPLIMVGSHIDITAHKDKERQTRESQYQDLIENAPFPVIISSVKEGRITYINKRARAHFGVANNEGIGLLTSDFYVYANDRDIVLEHLKNQRYIYDFEVELYNYNKVSYWALMSASLINYKDELSVLINLNDISNRRSAEEALKIENDKYQLLTQSMADVIWIYNLQSMRFTFISPSIFSLSGYTVEEALALRFDATFSMESVKRIQIDFTKHLQDFMVNPTNFPSFIHEAQQIRKDGSMVWVELSSRFRYNPSQQIEVISSVRNIDVRKHTELRLEYLKMHDDLTGLLNKVAFRLRIENSIHGPNQQESTIIYIDIDHFALINDTLGHGKGDKIINDIAQKIKHHTAENGEVYHYDGDEFIIILYSNEASIIELFIHEIKEIITERYIINQQFFILTTSIGYDCRKAQDTLENVFKNACTALFLAKKTRNKSVMFKPEMLLAQTRETHLENDLRLAIDRNELELYYQPIFNVNSGKIEEAEALLRWNHPHLGLIMPGEFIPIAERTRLILPITDWVIHKACQTIKEWDQTIKEPLNISINISFITISNRSNELFTYIKNELQSSGVSPSQLILEVTESSLIQDTNEVINVFTQFKELGVKLSLDDFGTGYSSFAYLKALPLDIVKIDRSLINNINHDPKGKLITESLITILHDLNLDVVAEGIETVDQYLTLEKMNIDFIQGYLLAKPVKLADFIQFQALAKTPDHLPIKPRISQISNKILYWHNEWNSGQPLIDQQHLNLMHLTSKIESEIILYSTIDHQIKSDVYHLLKAIKNHFDSEEEILREMEYENADHHCAEHQRLYSMASDYWNRCLNNQGTLLEFVKYISQEVIWDHLFREDLLFFSIFSNNQSAIN